MVDDQRWAAAWNSSCRQSEGTRQPCSTRLPRLDLFDLPETWRSVQARWSMPIKIVESLLQGHSSRGFRRGLGSLAVVGDSLLTGVALSDNG
jgi:hypothetical protein